MQPLMLKSNEASREMGSLLFQMYNYQIDSIDKSIEFLRKISSGSMTKSSEGDMISKTIWAFFSGITKYDDRKCPQKKYYKGHALFNGIRHLARTSSSPFF